MLPVDCYLRENVDSVVTY